VHCFGLHIFSTSVIFDFVPLIRLGVHYCIYSILLLTQPISSTEEMRKYLCQHCTLWSAVLYFISLAVERRGKGKHEITENVRHELRA
jgi:hypothetical protein